MDKRMRRVYDMEELLWASLPGDVLREAILAAMSIQQKEDILEYLCRVWDLIPDEEDDVPWYE